MNATQDGANSLCLKEGGQLAKVETQEDLKEAVALYRSKKP